MISEEILKALGDNGLRRKPKEAIRPVRRILIENRKNFPTRKKGKKRITGKFIPRNPEYLPGRSRFIGNLPVNLPPISLNLVPKKQSIKISPRNVNLLM